MGRFAVDKTSLGKQVVAVLCDHQGSCVHIACHGATLIKFKVPRGNDLFDIAAGYRDEAELLARSASRFAIMLPFGGRIDNARYPFGGKEHDLQPDTTGTRRGVMHGLVRDVDFTISSLHATAQCAEIVLSSTAIQPQVGYPYAIDLEVRYTLDAQGLRLESRTRNKGAHTAPCFFGWHPYFRVSDGSVDHWQLRVPSETLLRTDARLIALAGEAAYLPVDAVPALDFRIPRLIADTIIDQCYLDLVPDADQRIYTHLHDPASGFGINVWQEHGCMQVFTADTIDRDMRRSVALEPMECIPNAFNRPEYTKTIALEPGAERCFRCGVEVAHP